MQSPKLLVVSRDKAVVDQVVRVSARLLPRPEVVSTQTMGSVEQLLADGGPVDVLVAGPGTGTSSGFARLQAVRRQLPAMSVVLALSERPKSSLRDIIRTGAVDLVQLPVEDEALAGVLQAAIDMSLRALRSPPSSNGSSPAQRHPGSVFTVASASGGSGKTFFAINLAYFLHFHTGARSCVVDLDLQFGEVATALRLRTRYSLADILDRGDSDEADLQQQIEEYLAVHDTGIHVLAAPQNPADADRIEGAHVARVLEALRCRFDYVVVDTPPALTEPVITAMELSDLVHVLATLDVPSLRTLSSFLRTLEQLNVASENVRLVLNKAERDLGVDVDQLKKLYPEGFLVELPYVREVTKSLNLGTPMLALAPDSVISRELAAGLSSVVPAVDRETGAFSARRANSGFIARALRRSSLVRAGAP
jgi:pilus assembly protein CpaE